VVDGSVAKPLRKSAGGSIATGGSMPVRIGVLNAGLRPTNLWKQGVEAAKTFDTAAVTAALASQKFDAPSGFTLSVDPVNHHLHKPYFVAEVGATGSVQVVWKTPGVIAPVAPSPQ
jgi:hypothetical protein